MPSPFSVRMLLDRLAFVAVLAVPAMFVWAQGRMRGVSPEQVESVARIVNGVIGGVLVVFATMALLRRGHGNERLTALGCLVLSAGGLHALREIASRAAVTEALARAGRDVAVGDPGLVTPVRLVTLALAAAAAFLFLKAGRAGAWSLTFALAGAMLAADVALLALFVRTTMG